MLRKREHGDPRFLLHTKWTEFQKIFNTRSFSMESPSPFKDGLTTSACVASVPAF